MKKVLVLLAILAIASVAQAELLTTWTIAGDGTAVASMNTAAANIGQITVGDLSRVNLLQSSTAGFSANGWEDAGSQIQFSLTVNAGYQITGASLNSTGILGSNTGPRNWQWNLGETAVGSVLSRTVSTSYTWDSSLGNIGAGAGQILSIRTTDSVSVTGGTTATAGSTRINNLTFSGAVVPEPATMSLLGLGALAMVLRRKMKK